MRITLTTNLLVGLVSSDTDEITVASTSTIFAGTTNGFFGITNLADAFPDGPRAVSVTATATGFSSASGLITNYDVANAAFALLLPPSAREGEGGVSNALVQAGVPVGADVLVRLVSSNTNQIQLPATVLIPAGSNSVTFAFQVVDDGRIAGTPTSGFWFLISVCFPRREIPVSIRPSQIWPRWFNSAFVSRLGCKHCSDAAVS